MLKIRKRQLEHILKHCKSSAPVEACGILAGERNSEEKAVKRVYRCRNALRSQTEYLIEPQQQVKIVDQVEEAGLDLLGFYHSHPFPPRPSAIDKKRAHYIGYSYLIISYQNLEPRSWIWDGKRFERECLRII